jgi:hypothetical protein
LGAPDCQKKEFKMTESEGFVLMGFLRELIQTRIKSKDMMAHKLIDQHIDAQPDSIYLLVQRGIFLEMALQDANAKLENLKAQFNIADESEIFNPQYLGVHYKNWGANLEDPSDRPTFLASKADSSQMTLEDRAVKFLSKNSSKIWLLIALTWVVTLYIKPW